MLRATVRLLVPQEDDLIVSGVEDRLDLDVDHLPLQLLNAVHAVADVILLLLQVPHQLIAEIVL